MLSDRLVTAIRISRLLNAATPPQFSPGAGADADPTVKVLDIIFRSVIPTNYHGPIHSVAILRMSDADPLRAVQQQIGAMSGRISPLLSSPLR